MKTLRLSRHMFPFDPLDGSIQGVLIAVIIFLYAIVLIRLRPREEPEVRSNSGSSNTERTLFEAKPIRNPSVAAEIEKTGDREQTRETRFRKSPRQVVKENLQNNQIKVKQTSITEDKAREKQRKKSFFLFGEQKFGGCHHNLGHLGSVAKNTPIPDECFGCPDILECMQTKANEVE